MGTANAVLLGILGIFMIALVSLPYVARRYYLQDTEIRWGGTVIKINVRRLLAGAIIILAFLIAVVNLF